MELATVCLNCFGDEAMKTAAYLVNETPISTLNFEVPESAWSKNSIG